MRVTTRDKHAATIDAKFINSSVEDLNDKIYKFKNEAKLRHGRLMSMLLVN